MGKMLIYLIVRKEYLVLFLVYKWKIESFDLLNI